MFQGIIIVLVSVYHLSPSVRAYSVTSSFFFQPHAYGNQKTNAQLF